MRLIYQFHYKDCTLYASMCLYIVVNIYREPALELMRIESYYHLRVEIIITLLLTCSGRRRATACALLTIIINKRMIKLLNHHSKLLLVTNN